MTEQAEKKISSSRERSNANLRLFVKGQSGNPAGRSKKSVDVKKTAEEFIEEAIGVLAKSLKEKDAKVRIMAANAILDRGLGKPKQSVEVSRQKKALDELSTDDIIAALQSEGDVDGASETEARH